MQIFTNNNGRGNPSTNRPFVLMPEPYRVKSLIAISATIASLSATTAAFGSNTSGALQVLLNRAAGQVGAFKVQTAGIDRMRFGLNGVAEAGANAGSNVQLDLYDDAGVSIDSPLVINRASAGSITIGGTSARPVSLTGTLTVQGASASVGGNAQTSATFTLNSILATRAIQWQTAGSRRWRIYVSNAAEGGSDAGSLWVLEANTDAGAAIDNPLSFLRASAGLMTIGGSTARPVQFTGIIKTSAAQESTGGGSAVLSTNCPAVTVTAPYKWLKFNTSDGSVVYIPCWK